jgi:hypothetical protein
MLEGKELLDVVLWVAALDSVEVVLVQSELW